MTQRDLSTEDFDALLATHDSHRQALEVINRHRYPASSRHEAVGGMRALSALFTSVLAFAVAAITLLIASLSHYAPAIQAAFLPLVSRFVGWLT